MSEHVPQKFDYIHGPTIRTTSKVVRLHYTFLWLIILKAAIIYIADMLSLVLLWRPSVLDLVGAKGESINVGGLTAIGFFDTDGEWLKSYGKILYTTAVGVSLLILLYDTYAARKIIRTRDISLAVTNTIAYRYYSVSNYAYFCLFYKLQNSYRTKDKLAFFTFFTLKGWKRLIFAEAIRAIINTNTLYYTWGTGHATITSNFATFSAIFLTLSVLIFAISLLRTLAALFMYLPLSWNVGGNLEEYVCIKIDKRIGEVIRKQTAKRRGNNSLEMNDPRSDDLDRVRMEVENGYGPGGYGRGTYAEDGYASDASYFSVSSNQRGGTGGGGGGWASEQPFQGYGRQSHQPYAPYRG